MTVQAQPVMPADATAPVAIEDTHATTEAAHGGDESGGLPQFEFQHWFGQIVYLIVLFAILYFLIANVFAPRMRRVFDERSATISTARRRPPVRSRPKPPDQAEAAQAEVDDARAPSQRLAAAAKAGWPRRPTTAPKPRKLSSGPIAEAEAAIGKTRDAAMANVGTIASDTAGGDRRKLTGKAATAPR